MARVLKNLLLGVAPSPNSRSYLQSNCFKYPNGSPSNRKQLIAGKSSGTEVNNSIATSLQQSSGHKKITYVASSLDLVEEFWTFLSNSFSSSFISPLFLWIQQCTLLTYCTQDLILFWFHQTTKLFVSHISADY